MRIDEETTALAYHGLGVNWRKPVDTESSALRKWLLPYAVEMRSPLVRKLIRGSDGRVLRFATRSAARREAMRRRVRLKREFGQQAGKLVGWRAVKR